MLPVNHVNKNVCFFPFRENLWYVLTLHIRTNGQYIKQYSVCTIICALCPSIPNIVTLLPQVLTIRYINNMWRNASMLWRLLSNVSFKATITNLTSQKAHISLTTLVRIIQRACDHLNRSHFTCDFHSNSNSIENSSCYDSNFDKIIDIRTTMLCCDLRNGNEITSRHIWIKSPVVKWVPIFCLCLRLCLFVFDFYKICGHCDACHIFGLFKQSLSQWVKPLLM